MKALTRTQIRQIRDDMTQWFKNVQTTFNSPNAPDRYFTLPFDNGTIIFKEGIRATEVSSCIRILNIIMGDFPLELGKPITG